MKGRLENFKNAQYNSTTPWKNREKKGLDLISQIKVMHVRLTKCASLWSFKSYGCIAEGLESTF
jgi:hypothetical protein